MTPTEAQALQAAAVARGDWIMWFVTLESGLAVATARCADQGGGDSRAARRGHLGGVAGDASSRSDPARAHRRDVGRRGRDLGLNACLSARASTAVAAAVVISSKSQHSGGLPRASCRIHFHPIALRWVSANLRTRSAAEGLKRVPSPQSLSKPELEILIVLAALGQLPGAMVKTEILARKWCGTQPGRGRTDLERHIAALLQKEMLRENASKTTIGFTSAGHAQAVN